MNNLDTRETQLLAIGGSLWEKNGHRRIYFNVRMLTELLGYKIAYRRNSIDWATRNGSKISNSTAYHVVDHVNRSRFHYDLNRGVFSWYDSISRETANEIVEAIESLSINQVAA